MRVLAALLPVLALLARTAAHADTPAAEASPNDTRPTASVQGVAEVAFQNDGKYHIGVEDLLLISVWREPDLTREVPVRPDGKISLPLIQDVAAAGKTPAELGREVQERLREFLSNPAVTVVVREVNSMRVYLLGEVAKPGALPLRSEVRLLQAISMVGGLTPFGGRNGVVIYRKSESGEKLLKLSYRDIVDGKKPEDNVILQPGDTVVVH